MTFEKIIQKLIDKPTYMTNGAGLLSKRFKTTREEIYKAKAEVRNRIKDDDNLAYIVRNKRALQKARDLNKNLNKESRELFRATNTIEELNKAVIKKFNEVSFDIKVNNHLKISNSTIVVQLSDTHFNELVDLPNNNYDFKIASQRMEMYANEVKILCKAYNINQIVLALTGDLLNSDRRLDEITSQATNRAKASLIATNLLEYFILDLNQVANIKIVSVTGNESRIREEFGFGDIVVSDNYDLIIYNMLKLLFKGKKGIEFIDGNPVEQVLKINNKNILILHGTTIKKDTQAGIQQVIGKYAAKGFNIDYVLFGHVHFANITDLYARSGSLVGNNVYSDYGINLVTRASQNLHIIKENGTISNYRVELQNSDEFEGYLIQDDLEAYNAKSYSKLYKRHIIIEI